MTNHFPAKLTTSKPELTLRQLLPGDAGEAFRIIEENRGYLHDSNEPASWKYPHLEALRTVITNPKNPREVHYGTWLGERLIGLTELIPLSGANTVAEISSWTIPELSGLGYTTATIDRISHEALTVSGFGEVRAKIRHSDLEGFERLRSIRFQFRPDLKPSTKPGYDSFSRVAPSAKP